MADLTPQEALEQFERTTGYRIHAVTDTGGTVWWRQRRGHVPMFECTIGDRCMHIDELSAPLPPLSEDRVARRLGLFDDQGQPLCEHLVGELCNHGTTDTAPQSSGSEADR